MEKKVSANIIGELIPCPKLSNASMGAGIISLEECKKCEFHKGIQLVREGNEEKNYKEINNVICALPTQIRIAFHVEGVN